MQKLGKLGLLTCINRIKAIFSWQLTGENVLNHPGVIQLPGNPLHVMPLPQGNNTPPRIAVALDTEGVPEIQSLNIFALTVNDKRLAVDTTSHLQEPKLDDVEEPEVSEKELRTMLYTTEVLRKQPNGDDGEGED